MANPVVAVPVSIPYNGSSKAPLGVVDEIREAVRTARERHPALASSHLCDVSLRRAGDALRLILYFRVKPS